MSHRNIISDRVDHEAYRREVLRDAERIRTRATNSQPANATERTLQHRLNRNGFGAVGQEARGTIRHIGKNPFILIQIFAAAALGLAGVAELAAVSGENLFSLLGDTVSFDFNSLSEAGAAAGAEDAAGRAQTGILNTVRNTAWIAAVPAFRLGGKTEADKEFLERRAKYVGGIAAAGTNVFQLWGGIAALSWIDITGASLAIMAYTAWSMNQMHKANRLKENRDHLNAFYDAHPGNDKEAKSARNAETRRVMERTTNAGKIGFIGMPTTMLILRGLSFMGGGLAIFAAGLAIGNLMMMGAGAALSGAGFLFFLANSHDLKVNTGKGALQWLGLKKPDNDNDNNGDSSGDRGQQQQQAEPAPAR